MERINKFLHLSLVDQCLLIKSAFLLGLVQAGLRLLPFKTLQQLLAKVGQACVKQEGSDPDFIARAVFSITVASRYIPGAKCLARALAAQVLLARRGHPVRFHIGVDRSSEGKLEAHAWLESGGRIVIGGLADLSRYRPLLSMDRGNF